MKKLHLTDPTYTPRENPGPVDRFLLSLINDPRDLPFLHFMVQATVTLVPMAVLLFVRFHWALAAIYWPLNLFVFFDRFVLILHNTSHRPLFKPKYRFWNLYIPWVLGPLFGETPDTYFVHHLGMHHPENNLEDDLSTTLPFQRDSFRGWLRYFGRFLTLGLGELAIYLQRKNRKRLARRLLTGEFAFWIVVAILANVQFRATLVVFIIPVLFCRMVMMMGNWAQHAFIDASDPANPFKNSITVINCRYNRRSFNDGYHIGHHRKATRHWTEMPVEFERDLPLYAKEGAIIFEGLDFTTVWALLMLKRYGKLARHFVDLGTEPRSIPEIEALLRERTKPIVREAPSLALETSV